MCIMASPVQSVTNTKIFAGTDTRCERQVIVYGMSVQLCGKGGNAMILPVPAFAGDIQFIDLSQAPAILDDMDSMFLSIRPATKGRSVKPLPVQRVGSYVVSVVPTVDDLVRIDQSVFTVSDHTEFILRALYPEGFAFVVAQLTESGQFHPLAYSHAMTRDAMFIPTRHVHGDVDEGDEYPEWDHTIFHQQPWARIERRVPPEWFFSASNSSITAAEQWGAQAPDLEHYLRDGTLCRIRATGSMPNIDLSILPSP